MSSGTTPDVTPGAADSARLISLWLRDRRHALISAAVALATVNILIMVVPEAGRVLVAAGLFGVLAVLAVGHFGARPTATALMYFVFLVVGWNTFRFGPTVYAGQFYPHTLILRYVDAPLIATLALLLPLYLRSARRRRPSLLVLAAVALMAAGGLVGTLDSDRPDASLANIAQLVLVAAGLQLVVMVWAPDVRQIRVAILLLAVALALSAVLGVVHVDYRDGRMHGLAQHANQLGQMVALFAGPTIALALLSEGRRRLAVWALLLLMTLAMLLTGSRTGFVGVVAVMVMFVPLLRTDVGLTSRMAAIGVAGFALLAVSVMATNFSSDSVSEFFQADVNRSWGTDALSRMIRRNEDVAVNTQRLDVLSAGLDQATGSPLLGNGFADVLTTHNIYLQLWAAGGVLGLAGVLLIPLSGLWWLWRAYRPLADGTGSEAHLLLYGLAVGVLAYGVTGMFEPLLWARWFWVLPALAAVADHVASNDDEAPPVTA